MKEQRHTSKYIPNIHHEYLKFCSNRWVNCIPTPYSCFSTIGAGRAGVLRERMRYLRLDWILVRLKLIPHVVRFLAASPKGHGNMSCVCVCVCFLICSVVDGAIHDIVPKVVSMHKTLKVQAMLVNLGGRATQEKPQCSSFQFTKPTP